MATFRSSPIRHYLLPFIVSLLLSITTCSAWLSAHQTTHLLARLAVQPRLQKPFKLQSLYAKNGDENDDEWLDEFLDTPFFDPDKVLEDEKETNPLLNKLARFVKEDYNTFEALYVGAIFVVLVILSQELLRMSLYGDKYVPFTKLSDKLF